MLPASTSVPLPSLVKVVVPALASAPVRVLVAASDDTESALRLVMAPVRLTAPVPAARLRVRALVKPARVPPMLMPPPVELRTRLPAAPTLPL